VRHFAASVANEKVRKTRSIIAFDTNESICNILHLSLTMLQSFVTVMSAFRREKHFVIFLSILLWHLICYVVKAKILCKFNKKQANERNFILCFLHELENLQRLPQFGIK